MLLGRKIVTICCIRIETLVREITNEVEKTKKEERRILSLCIASSFSPTSQSCQQQHLVPICAFGCWLQSELFVVLVQILSPFSLLLLLLKCLCSAAFKFNISNHDKVCCLWKLSQNMSSKTVVGLQKQTLLEATATCSSWETEGEKIVLRRFAARQGWHLTVVMRDKWGRRSRGLSCELSKQFQVHCSRCLDFRVLKVYAQVAASYLCRLPTSFFANWLYEVTWPRGSQDLTTLSRHNRKDANKNWRLEKWHDTKIIFGKFFDVWVVSAPLHNLFQ